MDLEPLCLYTIGHSDHELAAFIGLLRKHAIERLVDVRSQPYSRWQSQFNRETLAPALREAGIDYVWGGDTLGGRPADLALYNPGEERPDYERMADTPLYQGGIEHLLEGAQTGRTAIMCSEGDPSHCHRHLLITQTLVARGIRVFHVLPDGDLREGELIPQQLTLF